ncbi:MAG TPA: hypothetical protein GX697_02125, partial [Firmicutes bacterium]|nr:hypothetical protein [Bacillota bacterium]
MPGDKTVFVSLEELGIYPDYEEIFALACREGRRREGILALFTRYKTIKGVAIPFKYRLDEEKLARSIDLLAQKFNSDPVDAFFRVINHDSLLVPERKGIRVNKKALADRLLENL